MLLLLRKLLISHQKLLKEIEVEYELLEPVFTYDDALKEGAPVIHDEEESFVLNFQFPYEPKKNIVAKVGMEAGNFEKGMSESDYTFDELFETPYCSALSYRRIHFMGSTRSLRKSFL